MINTLLPLLLTVAIAPNSLPNTELTQRLPCEEVYIELLRGVEEGYIQEQAADEVYKRCLGNP